MSKSTMNMLTIDNLKSLMDKRDRRVDRICPSKKRELSDEDPLDLAAGQTPMTEGTVYILNKEKMAGKELCKAGLVSKQRAVKVLKSYDQWRPQCFLTPRLPCS